MKTTAYVPGSGFLLGLLALCLFLVCSDLGFEEERARTPDRDGWARLVDREATGRFFRVRSGETLSAFLGREVPGLAGNLSPACSRVTVGSGQEIRLEETVEGAGSLSCRIVPLAESCRVLLGMPLNINRAGLEELQILPGIGPALARRILGAREACGGFSSLPELFSIRGIGAGLLKTIGRHATVEP